MPMFFDWSSHASSGQGRERAGSGGWSGSFTSPALQQPQPQLQHQPRPMVPGDQGNNTSSEVDSTAHTGISNEDSSLAGASVAPSSATKASTAAVSGASGGVSAAAASPVGIESAVSREVSRRMAGIEARLEVVMARLGVVDASAILEVAEEEATEKEAIAAGVMAATAVDEPALRSEEDRATSQDPLSRI